MPKCLKPKLMSAQVIGDIAGTDFSRRSWCVCSVKLMFSHIQSARGLAVCQQSHVHAKRRGEKESPTNPVPGKRGREEMNPVLKALLVRGGAEVW